MSVMNLRLKRILCLLMLASFLACHLPAGAFYSDRVVRVAYPLQPAISDMDENGNYTGYTYEYLEEVAQYTGWDYEFVTVPGTQNESITTLMEMVRVGEVDLMGATFYSDVLAENYDYSSHSYGVSETLLQIPYGVISEQVLNSQLPQTFRVAVLSLTGRMVRELEDYCAMNLITTELVLCEDSEDQVQAVKDGRADMLLNSSYNYIPNVRIIARFAPKPFYFITAKGGDSQLLQDLNSAMMSIDQADPLFVNTLYDKYFNTSAPELQLSEEELEYLANTPTLSVGFLTSQPPFQHLDEDGNPAGIAIDLLSNIAAKLGITLDFQAAQTPEELYALAASQSVHMMAGMPYDYDLARAKGLSMTQPYVSSQYILVAREALGDQLENKRQALLPNANPLDNTSTLVYCSTTAECIQAVNQGKADYTYVDTYTAQYYLNLPQYRSLKLSPQSYDLRKSCFGITKTGQKALLTILNKSIVSMDPVELQGIINQNTMRQGAFTPADLLLEYPVESIAVIAGVLLFIILILLYFLRQRAAMSRSRALELKKHYQVYALVNEHFFEYDYRDQTLLVSSPPTEADTSPTPFKFDFSPKPGDERAVLRHNAFLEFIISHESGIHEVYLDCIDGQYHWLRLALETVYDGTRPVYALGKINIIDHEHQEKEVLLEKASSDSLTHLCNAETARTLTSAAIEALPSGHMGALLLVDVDYFKSINDTYGHLQGDNALIQVADLLRASFRESDILARPGGDEFLIFMSSVPDEEALESRCALLCERARNLSETGPSLTISVGAALVRPGDSYDQLYALADQALYQAKHAGRDRFVVVQR